MKRSLFVLALLLPSTLLSGEPRWIKVTSSNFELYTTAGEKKGREGILHFEQVRSFFLKGSGQKLPAKSRVRIIAFQSEKEYRPYRINEGTTAHAGGSQGHDEIVMQSIAEENYPVAVHEYVHILLKPVENVPLWLNEGEAEFFSTLKPVGKKVRVGDLLPGRLLELRDGKWLDLETLCAVGHDSPYYNEKDKQRTFYAESWALTHMLMLDDNYRSKLADFLHQIHAGATESDAFHSAFGKSPGEVWKDLQAYLRRDRFNVAIYDVTLEKSAEAPEIRPATPLEIGLALAGILANIPRKHDEARQAFEKLAIDFPVAPEIPEGLGYLAWRSQNPGEARAQFAKAVELGSRNGRLYYDYVGLAGAEPARRIPLLRKAIELDPEFRDARLELAYAQMAVEDYKGALVSFAGMKKVEPKEAFQFFRAVAYAQYRLGEKDEARRAAGRAAGYARNPGEKVAIEQLIEAMRDRPPEPAPRQGMPEQTEPPRQHRLETADAPPPVLRRRTRTTVVGTLEQLDCLGEAGRLRLRAGGQTLKLLMNDPKRIEVRGAETGMADLTCGPQKPRRVRVEYEPSTDDKLGTSGVVRAIEFQ